MTSRFLTEELSPKLVGREMSCLGLVAFERSGHSCSGGGGCEGLKFTEELPSQDADLRAMMTSMLVEAEKWMTT